MFRNQSLGSRDGGLVSWFLEGLGCEVSWLGSM